MTHLLWQIPLTIIAWILLCRIAILTLTAGSLRWSKLRYSATLLLGKNLQTTNWNESGRGTGHFELSKVDGIGLPILDDSSIVGENAYGSTGITPGGVSFTVVPQRGGALIPKGRKRFRRNK